MSHLKSFVVPKSWTLRKKEKVFSVRPKPGAHPSELSVPLAHMLRSLGYADTVREIKQVIHNRGLLVDGRVVKDHRMPVGFMDVVEFKPLSRTIRLLLNAKGRIVYVDAKDPSLKVLKVRGKTVLPGGKLQLNLSDGRNLVSDKDCKVGDSLVITLPYQKVEKVLKLDKGANVYLLKGRHTSKSGVVENVEGNRLWFKSGDEVFETLKDYALVIGDFKIQ